MPFCTGTLFARLLPSLRARCAGLTRRKIFAPGRRGIRGECGISLIEVIIGAAIVGAISLVVGVMSYQLVVVPRAGIDHMQAVLIVENVGDRLIRDGQQAKSAEVDISSVNVTGGTRKLRLSSQYSTDAHVIDYVLLTGNQLRRDDYLNGSQTPVSAVIGENITTFGVTASGAQYQVTIGVTVSGLMNQSTELTYAFKPRL